jgi:hypothetical protein
VPLIAFVIYGKIASFCYLMFSVLHSVYKLLKIFFLLFMFLDVTSYWRSWHFISRRNQTDV